MPLVLYPKLNNEVGLPVYVTGVGVGTSGLSAENGIILISVKGDGDVSVNGKIYQVPHGHGIYIKDSVNWCTVNPVDKVEEWVIDWVAFAINDENLKSALFTKNDIELFHFSRPAMVSEDIRKILEAVSKNDSYSGFFASSMMYAMLIELNRETIEMTDSKDRGNGVIGVVIDYINQHYTESITLEELCRVAGGLSEQYFCRLFKQNTGTRPIEYILRKRIGVARTYLEKTDMPISDVAKKTGFNNTSYFYRNFKKFMGISPLTCRQNSHYLSGVVDTID